MGEKATRIFPAAIRIPPRMAERLPIYDLEGDLVSDVAPINSLIQFSLPRGEAKTDN